MNLVPKLAVEALKRFEVFIKYLDKDNNRLAGVFTLNESYLPEQRDIAENLDHVTSVYVWDINRGNWTQIDFNSIIVFSPQL